MGYDSDGEIPDFTEMEREKEDINLYNKPAFLETPPTNPTPGTSPRFRAASTAPMLYTGTYFIAQLYWRFRRKVSCDSFLTILIFFLEHFCP